MTASIGVSAGPMSAAEVTERREYIIDMEAHGDTWSWELGRMWEDICEFVEEHLGYDPETGEDREVYP